MKYPLLLIVASALAAAQFEGSIIPPTTPPCGQKCIQDNFKKASTNLGCKVDDYRCYCTKREFWGDLKTCVVACGEDVELEVVEWRNIFCQAGAGAPAYTVPAEIPAATP